MAKRKQRFLQDLYSATRTLSHPKITPILRGNCWMRGPVDDSESDFHTNTVPSQIDKEYSSHRKNLKSDCRAESGNCNVCSAPCSSCLHINQHQMGSKIDECSGEACAENAPSVSVNDAFPDEKFVICEVDRKTETRKFLRGVSSGTSENVDCEAIRNSELSATSENITALPKVEDPKGQEDHDHHWSCVTGAEDTKLHNFSVRNEDGLAETTSDTAGNVTHLLRALGKFSDPSIDSSSLGDPGPDDLEGNLLESPSEHLTSLSTMVVTSGPSHNDLAVDTVDSVEKNKGIDKVMASQSVLDANENSFEIYPMDESDDSDMVEHDVKVCDICGDAGREDLLAICSRCSDGAEHTYCMQEMVDKVPEGDWVCEECKFDVVKKHQRQEKNCLVDGMEKNNSSGQENPENANFFTKSEAKGSNVVGNKTGNDLPSVNTFGKRHCDDAEVDRAAKKCVLEPEIGSAKVSTSSGSAALSRDSSLKHLEKGRAKPTQHSSSGSVSALDTVMPPASGSRLHAPQGTFIKSKSFNSLNVKPKVKLVDHFVPQKQRSVRESAYLDKKEGAARSMSKSMSFRSTNLGRPSIGESKVKMLYPKETKGSKHTKDRNLSERMNSFKSKRMSVSPPMASAGALAAKNDQKLVSSGELHSLSSAKQSESRPVILSKSSSFTARSGAELPVPLGEFKRQSSTCALRVSSLNGNNGHDMKPNQVSPKEDSSLGSNLAEAQPCIPNEGLPDGLSPASRPKESTNFDERAKDSIWSPSRQSSTINGRILLCRKCKEIGHLAQFCTADPPGSPAPDATAAKTPREKVEGKDKLKAAIEAAVLRKPGIYKKHRVSDQFNEATLSSSNSEIATQDQLLDSSNRGNLCALGGMQEGKILLDNSTTDSAKQETFNDNVKQFHVLSIEASTSRIRDVYPVVPLDRLSLARDLPNGVSAATCTVSKKLAVPDHDYLWQGIFEVSRTGKPLNLFDGIQAHISTCASHKVRESVNKFAYKVLLCEVPRLTTWPLQFQKYGVKEDNVALFFFAKDLASYENSYKVLLDNMMKYDLALKGSFDGFELMIFPSNQLPEKSQRWNALYFLWGVFRGKRTDCSRVSCSDKQTFISQGSSKSLALEATASELACLSPSKALKQGCHGRVSSDVTNNDPVLSVETQDNKLDSSSLSVLHNSVAKSRGAAVQTSVLCDKEDGVDFAHQVEQEHQNFAECTRRGSDFSKSQVNSVDQNSHLSRLHASHYFGEPSGCAGDILDKMSSSQYKVSTKDGSLNEDSSCGIGNRIVKDNYENHLSEDDISVGVRSSKKQKTDVCRLFGASDQTSSSIEGLATQVHGGPSGSRVQVTAGDKAFDGAGFCEIKENAERYLFPVVPDPGKDAGLVGKFMSWEMGPLGEDRRQDIAPNLELALGAESTPVPQGTPPFSVGKEDKKIIQDHCSNEAAIKGDEDDISASLSLSLSFPFTGNERTVKSLSNTEQLMPQRRHVNTSLLLFGGLREK